jgi:hypothetical protein
MARGEDPDQRHIRGDGAPGGRAHGTGDTAGAVAGDIDASGGTNNPRRPGPAAGDLTTGSELTDPHRGGDGHNERWAATDDRRGSGTDDSFPRPLAGGAVGGRADPFGG